MSVQVLCLGVLLQICVLDSQGMNDIDFSGGSIETENTISCPGGTIADTSNEFCLMCYEGTYESDNTECLDCDIGFYNDEEGATTCQSCPEGLSTIAEGSTSDQCIEVCEVTDVAFSDASSPVVGSRVTPDTSVIVSCVDGYQIDNRDHMTAECQGVVASCANVTIWGSDTVQTGSSATLTCQIMTTVAPTGPCNWYSGLVTTTWLGDSELVQMTLNSYQCELVLEGLDAAIVVSCKVPTQGFTEQSNNEFRISVTDAPLETTDSEGDDNSNTEDEEENVPFTDNDNSDNEEDGEEEEGSSEAPQESVQKMVIYVVMGLAGFLVLIGIALPIIYIYFDGENRREQRKSSYHNAGGDGQFSPSVRNKGGDFSPAVH